MYVHWSEAKQLIHEVERRNDELLRMVYLHLRCCIHHFEMVYNSQWCSYLAHGLPHGGWIFKVLITVSVLCMKFTLFWMLQTWAGNFPLEDFPFGNLSLDVGMVGGTFLHPYCSCPTVLWGALGVAYSNLHIPAPCGYASGLNAT